MVQTEVHAARIEAVLRKSIEGLVTGGGWLGLIEELAAASGAGGACLVRDRNGRDVAVLPTESVADAVADYVKGNAPPNPRCTPRSDAGFVTDFDEFRPEDICRSPFYQEFLASAGFGWHACAFLTDLRGGDRLLLSLKRRKANGHYERDDISILNSFLPSLRAISSVSECLLEAGAKGSVEALRHMNEIVIRLDSRGMLLNLEEVQEFLPQFGLSSYGGRLVALPPDHQRLDRAVHSALMDECSVPSRLVIQACGAERRVLVTLLPVTGAARDVFRTTAALVAVRSWRRQRKASDRVVAELAAAFELTKSEARTAALVGAGLSPNEAAELLVISKGTLRNYLKTAYHKTGTTRQAELAVLVTHFDS